MVALGLMVPILAREGGNEEDSLDDLDDSDEFLVPAILPDEPPAARRLRSSQQQGSVLLTVRVVFAAAATVHSWRRSGFVSLRAVVREGHVPAGAFSRLLGGLTSLCQQTEPYPYVLDMRIWRDVASFQLGRSRFSVTKCAGYLTVRVEEGTGYGVSEVLQEQLSEIVKR